MSDINDLLPNDAWNLLIKVKNSRLIDVRTHLEWVYVGFPDLSSINKDILKLEWVYYPSGNYNTNFLKILENQFKKDTTLIFICKSGHRSALAAQAASKIGFKSVFNLKEGFEGDLNASYRGISNGWKARGLPWMQT